MSIHLCNPPSEITWKLLWKNDDTEEEVVSERFHMPQFSSVFFFFILPEHLLCKLLGYRVRIKRESNTKSRVSMRYVTSKKVNGFLSVIIEVPF